MACENKLNDVQYDGFDYINYYFFRNFDRTIAEKCRRSNVNYLHKFCKYKCISKLYFTYPIVLNTKDERESLKNALIRNKIYCTVLWPLYFDKQELCNSYISDRILCIPIDQRYNLTHMKYITTILNTHYDVN